MLEVRHAVLHFGPAAALDGFHLRVADGEVVSVLGPSGCGKSTLLRAIGGLEHLEEGDILWDDRSLRGVPPHQRGFGLMFQDYSLFPHKTVAGNVGFGLRMEGVGREELRDMVTAALRMVGLEGYGERSIGNLSGGEQQRVALARALAPRPRMLMLDEPLGALDRTLKERLLVELRGLFVHLGITGLYVTHDQEEAFSVSDRVVVMRAGRVAQEGTPEEVYRAPADEWVARFLGFANIVRAEVRGGEAVTPWGTFALGASEPVPGPTPGPRDRTVRTEGSLQVVIPPDALVVTDSGEVAATVLTRTFRGGHYLLRVHVEGGPELEVELQRGPTPTPGERIRLAVLPGSVAVIPAGSE